MSGWDEMISRLDQAILPRDEKDFAWWLVAAMILLIGLHMTERGTWKKIGKRLEYILSEKCPYCRGVEFRRVK